MPAMMTGKNLLNTFKLMKGNNQLLWRYTYNIKVHQTCLHQRHFAIYQPLFSNEEEQCDRFDSFQKFRLSRKRNSTIPKLSSASSVEDWEFKESDEYVGNGDIEQTEQYMKENQLINREATEKNNPNTYNDHLELQSPDEHTINNDNHQSDHSSKCPNPEVFKYGELALIKFLKKTGSKRPKLIRLLPQGILPTIHRGQLSSDDIVEQEEGVVLETTYGYKVQVMRPSLEEYVTLMKRGPIICQPKVTAAMLSVLGVLPGDTILEAGTGSGGSLLMLSKAVGAGGHIHTVEKARRHRGIAEVRMSEWMSSYEARTGTPWPENVTFHSAKLDEEIPEAIKDVKFDGIYLDVKFPHDVLPIVADRVKEGKSVAVYCPNVTQITSIWDSIAKNNLPLLVENYSEEVNRQWIIDHYHPRGSQLYDIPYISPMLDETATAFIVHLRKVKSVQDVMAGPTKQDSDTEVDPYNLYDNDREEQHRNTTSTSHMYETLKDEGVISDMEQADPNSPVGKMFASLKSKGLLEQYEQDRGSSLLGDQSMEASVKPMTDRDDYTSKPFDFGDLILVAPFRQNNKGKRLEYLVHLNWNGFLNTYSGYINHSEFVGLHEGQCVKTRSGKFLHAVRPSLEHFTRSISNRYITGRLSRLVSQLMDLETGDHVLLSGRSSGVMPLYMSMNVGENGHIHSMDLLDDFHQDKENFDKWRRHHNNHSSHQWPDNVTFYEDVELPASHMFFKGACFLDICLDTIQRVYDKLLFGGTLIFMCKRFTQVLDVIGYVQQQNLGTIEAIYEDYYRPWMVKPHGAVAEITQSYLNDIVAYDIGLRKDGETKQSNITYMCRPKHKSQSAIVFIVKIKKTAK